MLLQDPVQVQDKHFDITRFEECRLGMRMSGLMNMNEWWMEELSVKTKTKKIQWHCPIQGFGDQLRIPNYIIRWRSSYVELRF